LHKEDVFEDAVGEIGVVSNEKASSLDRGYYYRCRVIEALVVVNEVRLKKKTAQEAGNERRNRHRKQQEIRIRKTK
jgi:hypothetical protein